MPRYLARRLLGLVGVVFGVSTLMFFLLRLSGDPINLFVTDLTTPEEIERLRRSLGLDAPLWLQYVRYVGKAVTGDFGESLRNGQPALDLVLERLPASLELALAALVFAIVVGLPCGVIAATRRGSLVDSLVMAVSVLGQGMPVFWLGILLILLFAADLRLLPAGGRGTLANLILPAFALGVYPLARIARLTRSGMLEVLGQDFIRTAHAKGLHPRTVNLRHALRAASISIATVIGLTFSGLASGVVITETIFSWPGLGRLLITSVGNRDFPVVQAAVFAIAIIVALGNLVTDLVYAFLDPRIRYD